MLKIYSSILSLSVLLLGILSYMAIQPYIETLPQNSSPTHQQPSDFKVYLPFITMSNYKKGLGVVVSPGCADMQSLHAAWYFNWSVYPDGDCAGFVPRIYNAQAMSNLNIALENAKNSGWLIGFSEPNLVWQGGMSPQDGARYWKQIEDAALPLGIKLVSPSPNQWDPGQGDPRNIYGNQWLWDMVDAYRQQNDDRMPHFDAIGWNIYKQSAEEMANYLTIRHNEAKYRGYDVPIWVLEYGGECWNTASGNTGNNEIMTQATTWFNQTPWIRRYAWYANRLTHTTHEAIGWESCTLLDPTTGNITELGQIYQKH